MNIQQAYNSWATQYDTNLNKTRDLEGAALRALVKDLPFRNCLEIGCGTGKNTVWLAQQGEQVKAVDFSEEMLARAQAKVTVEKVKFVQADITQPWSFGYAQYDLVTFSLVLEHIEELKPIFQEAVVALAAGGYVYVGELHPFKQYTGSKARFDTEDGQQVVTCFTHHISDFVQTARECGLEVYTIQEFFDENDRTTIPRILAIIFRKPISKENT